MSEGSEGSESVNSETGVRTMLCRHVAAGEEPTKFTELLILDSHASGGGVKMLLKWCGRKECSTATDQIAALRRELNGGPRGLIKRWVDASIRRVRRDKSGDQSG